MEENKQDVEQTEDIEKNVEEVETVETVEAELVDETEENENSHDEKVKGLEEEIKNLSDKVMRQMAEFDNFRKRTTKEKQSSYADGSRHVIEKLLPVVDNFERAFNAEENNDSAFYQGVEMIFKQLNGVFEELGVKQIPTVGEEFDPNVHFAVAKEDNEEFGENTVSEELQKGYIHGDKVIRPAMVKVAN